MRYKNSKEDPRHALLKMRRELRKEILGSNSAKQRLYSEATKTRLAIKAECLGKNSKKKDTDVEISFEKFLLENNIVYKKQKRIRYLNYDFFIPDLPMLIEIQGQGHHWCPVCDPSGPRNQAQRESIDKDEKKRIFAAEAGIQLEQVCGHEIKQGFSELRNKILDKFKEKNKT